jgi:hypothetical protein
MKIIMEVSKKIFKMHESRRDTMWEEEGDNWGRKDDKKGKVWDKYDQSTFIYTCENDMK